MAISDYFYIPFGTAFANHGGMPQQGWESFLRIAGCDTALDAVLYKADSEPKRRAAIESLISAGKLRVIESSVPHILPSTDAHLTCADFAKRGKWSADLCCLECHQSGPDNEDFFHFDGYATWMHGIVCCHAQDWMQDWHPSKKIDLPASHGEPSKYVQYLNDLLR